MDIQRLTKISATALLAAAVALLLLFLLIQLVPYGRNHTNPPIGQEFAWDSDQTRDLAQRACFDCHSNETVWPGYSQVAPISWVVQHHIEEGRQHLNFSDWNSSRASRAVRESVEAIQEREMPPAYYLIAHPEARLTADEKQMLIDGLNASIR